MTDFQNRAIALAAELRLQEIQRVESQLAKVKEVENLLLDKLDANVEFLRIHDQPLVTLTTLDTPQRNSAECLDAIDYLLTSRSKGIDSLFDKLSLIASYDVPLVSCVRG